jgi:vesicle-associated membrane protein 4
MNNPENNQTNNNLSALRDDVAVTTNVLRGAVDKLVQRGENLDALNNRAEDLGSTSYHFRGTARRVNRQMRWQSWKLSIFISKFFI